MDDSSYTNSEAGNLFAGNEKWLSIVLICVGAFSLIFFFKFKKQRKFPANILGWLVISNMTNDTWLLIKWGDSNFHESLSKNINTCNLAIFMDIFHLTITLAINTLMTFTLFMLLRLNKEYEYASNKRYLWGYILFVLLVPILVGITVVESRPQNGGNWNCYAQAPYIFAYHAVFVVMILAQIIFICLTLRSMYVIISAATANKVQSKRNIRLIYLTVRFIICVMAEIVAVSGVLASALYPGQELNRKSLVNSLLWNYAVGEFVDALVLLFGNQSLWKWLYRKKNNRKSVSSSDDSEKMVSSMKQCPSMEQTPTPSIDPPPPVSNV